jgi:hypothetical protein
VASEKSMPEVSRSASREVEATIGTLSSQIMTGKSAHGACCDV